MNLDRKEHDITFSVRVKQEDPASISHVQCFLKVKGFIACQCYRIAHDLWANGRKASALLIQNRVSEIFATDIHPGIGAGSMVLKSVPAGSIVVGNSARLIGVELSIFIRFKHCTSTNAASICFLFKLSTSTKATYYETGFPRLSSPLPIHEKNSKSPGDDLLLLMKKKVLTEDREIMEAIIDDLRVVKQKDPASISHDQSKIGAGSMVLKPVPAGSIVVEKVKLDVEQEPLLSEYYFCTILAHNSMEGALANSLSLKLSTSSLPSDTLYQLFFGVLTEDREIMEAVIDDLRVVKQKDPASISHVQCFLKFKGFIACQCYRIAHDLWANGRKASAVLIRNRVSEIFATDIHPGIGAGSMVLKPVLAGSIVVGNPAWLIGVEHSTSTNAACIRFLFKHSTSTKATYYETGFPCLSSPLPIHVKNLKSPGVDLWLLMKEEVKLDVEQEPLLSKYYLSTILAHNSMEGALANSLSLKLILAHNTLSQLFFGVLTADREIMEAVINDLRVVKQKDPASISHVQFFLKVKGFIACKCYRRAHDLWANGRKASALLIQNRVSEIFATDIHPGIGEGSMVLKPVPARSILVGNPARMIICMSAIHFHPIQALYFEESWDDLLLLMKEKVKLDVEQEPLLSEYYFCTILALNSMEGALSNSLSLKLSTSSLPSDTLCQLFLGVITEDQEIMEAVIDDLRIAHDLWANGRKASALSIQNRVSEIFATDIHLGIGAGSMVLKPVSAGSIVVGNPARLIAVELSIFIPFNHSTSTNAACIRFLFKHSPSTKATYYETGFPCLSYPMPIHEKNSKSPEEDLSHLMKEEVKSSFICLQSIFIPFKHSTSTNAACIRFLFKHSTCTNAGCIRFLFKHSTSTKATYYETGFPCLSSPLPIHEKISKSPGVDLWMLMKEEVKLDIEQEPLLSEYYFSTILAHNSTEGALANTLSLKQSTFSLPSDTPSQLFLGVLTEDQKIMEAVIDDLRVAKEKNLAKYLKYLPLIFILGQKLEKEIFSILGWVGDGVVIRMGTCALGNIRVQNEAKIGAGSMALKPVPAGSTVGGVVANSLSLKQSTSSLPSDTLYQLFLKDVTEDQEIMEDVIDDLRVVEEKDPTSISHVQCFLKVNGFLACQCYRIAHDLWANGRKASAVLIQNRVSEIFATDIHPGARNGKGIFLDHGMGSMVLKPVPAGSIVVEKVKLDVEQEPHLSEYYFCTILAHNSMEGALANSLSLKLSTSSLPSDTLYQLFFGVLTEDREIMEAVIDDLRVVKKASALLIQNRVSEIFATDIHPGIGAGSMVLKPVPAGSIVVGNPARLIGVEHSTSTKATYYETGFPCLSSPLPIHVKNSKSPGVDLWLLMKEEVKLDVEQEPLLSKYYLSTILAHNSMEGALANSLSLKLILAHNTLYQLFFGVLTADREIMEAVINDLRVVKQKDPASISHVQFFLKVKGFIACKCYRIAHDLWANGRKASALLIQNRVSEIFATDIHPGIGEGSMVLKPVPARSILVGNPARLIGVEVNPVNMVPKLLLVVTS
ncbi:hypothetical protein BUALT_Bualt18G0027900 [Buddleja alternifolia]|uniref:Serine acetyltransferase N-terminal domain-containing protein n=1 Tax=Buddleja alternifolia TaxID=168488 RepID=A0AAV6WCD9_9LAMI|nr:hypothetical protein BUALT_Bualt18G0027900 [Buddleja alternifolia]